MYLYSRMLKADQYWVFPSWHTVKTHALYILLKRVIPMSSGSQAAAAELLLYTPIEKLSTWHQGFDPDLPTIIGSSRSAWRCDSIYIYISQKACDARVRLYYYDFSTFIRFFVSYILYYLCMRVTKNNTRNALLFVDDDNIDYCFRMLFVFVV